MDRRAGPHDPGSREAAYPAPMDFPAPSVLVSALVSSLLLPPMVQVLLAAGGLLLMRRRRRLGVAVVLFALGSLTLLATPAISERMLRSLEPPALDLDALPRGAARPVAIVLLGGGTHEAGPEYGGDTLSPFTLERVRYVAWLHRRTGLPVLVSGGRPLGTRRSEAEVMRDALAEYGVATRWLEGESPDTRRNAQMTAQTLRAAGLGRGGPPSVLLVTHAWHLPRATRAFERAGLAVIGAGTGYTAMTPAPLAWLPGARALRDAHFALREWLGEAWYRLHFAATSS